jgi:hypothetical protein
MELADARAALSQAKEQLSSQLLSPARQRAATKVASAEPAKSNDSEAMEQLREELAASQRRARSLQVGHAIFVCFCFTVCLNFFLLGFRSLLMDWRLS